MTKEELQQLEIRCPSEEIKKQVQANWDAVAKPLDGLGAFEALTAKLGAALGTADFDLTKKAVIVMCADNGIVAEGVSQSGQEVTAAVAASMGKQASSVGKMAKSIGADVFPVDIGINSTEKIDGVLDQKIRSGTRDFLMEPAMTEAETLAAIEVGMELVRRFKAEGYSLLATGEMGIGNTTTSSAVAAALSGCAVEEITGRGAGLSDAGLLRKRQVIAEALQKYDFGKNETFRILSTVGGLDIAGLAGVFIGGALYQIPVVLDGVISTVAALVAERLVPEPAPI